MLKLAIQPKPVSTWGVTLASRLPADEWNKIRQKIYWEANYACQVCGNTSNGLNCHEVWAFNDQKRIQKLIGFACLCGLCHDVVHFGRSSQVYPKTYQDELVTHWCKVNGKTRGDFKRHEAKIYAINRKRADKDYIVKVGRKILT